MYIELMHLNSSNNVTTKAKSLSNYIRYYVGT